MMLCLFSITSSCDTVETCSTSMCCNDERNPQWNKSSNDHSLDLNSQIALKIGKLIILFAPDDIRLQHFDFVCIFTILIIQIEASKFMNISSIYIVSNFLRQSHDQICFCYFQGPSGPNGAPGVVSICLI